MVGAVTAILCIPISTATMLVDVASCVVSSLIIDRVVEDKCCLVPSRGWLLMDRYLLFVLGRLITLLRGCSSSQIRRAWEFEGSGMLRSSIVAAMTFWPARGKRLTGCFGSPSPTICRCTSRARLRALPPDGYGYSCSRICSSRTRRSRSSSSFALSSHNCASCAALSSCGGGST